MRSESYSSPDTSKSKSIEPSVSPNLSDSVENLQNRNYNPTIVEVNDESTPENSEKED